MNIFRLLAGAVLALALGACGGGGGSPGTTGNSGGGDSDSPTVIAGTVTLDLVEEKDGEDVVVTDKKLSQNSQRFLRATVKNATGTGIDSVRVVFELDSTEAVLVPVNGVALTENGGIAKIKVAPASVSSQGVVTAKTLVTLNGIPLAAEMFLSISPGEVTLENLKLIPVAVQKGQSVVTSVEVKVDGKGASSNAVGVVFSSTCGTVSPAVSLVDASGKANAVVQTNAVGDCSVNATYNAVSETAAFKVTAPPITGIKFLSASPSIIYQAGSTAVKTSIVSFQVIDSLGVGVPSIPVSAELTNTDGGINFCGSPHTAVNSDATGTVSFSVCSGTLPATVQVRASIDASSPEIYTDSNLLTIQTGLPTQRFFDISASAFNYYVGGLFTSKFNGNEIDITVFAADRQGNPVPPGTPIVFVAEGGQIISSSSSSCLIGTNGRCTVKLVGQDYRPLGSMTNSGGELGDPRPGRVTVLAYADGEESFIDKNFNNRYDSDELFEDLGIPFMDKNENGEFDLSYTNRVMMTNEGEFQYPIIVSATGASDCPANSSIGLSSQKTCNGKWDGQTKVRRQIVIVFSGGEIGQPDLYDDSIPLDNRTKILSSSNSGILVRIADYNGNPLPAVTALSTEVLKVSGECTARLVGSTIGSTTEPTVHSIILEKCNGGETVLFKSAVQNKDSILSIPVPVP